MILQLAVEQVTVSIKGLNVVLRSIVAPWIPTLSSLICSCHHLSVPCLHFALHCFDVIPWCTCVEGKREGYLEKRKEPLALVV